MLNLWSKVAVRSANLPAAFPLAQIQQLKDGFGLALARLGKGFIAPRLPVDRIVHVLPQIRRRLRGEAVGHTVIFAGRRELGGGQHGNTRLLTGIGESLIVRHHLDSLWNRESRGEMNRVE